MCASYICIATKYVYSLSCTNTGTQKKLGHYQSRKGNSKKKFMKASPRSFNVAMHMGKINIYNTKTFVDSLAVDYLESQSCSLEVFLNFFNNKKLFFAFFIMLI